MIKVITYLLVIVILGFTRPAFAAPKWMTMIELPMLTYQIDQETVGITGKDKDDRQMDVGIKLVNKNQGGADKHTITRLFKGNSSLGIVHYAMKSLMTPEKRDVGFSIIEGVKYSDHPL
ncbi:hypothetical protein SAMN05660742_12644 [Propionispira arboris]|uniref:Uncharacterized protein n=1 Tax=Propionispira arboris TaxID=84035 RepID=A0A1H7CW62_9FIRM|nr:hypothetical protein [Propionispira arboris]SEJ93888.1 hypothetical protein SAMN05660742_12644 [Propionispira arboris]